MAKEIIGHTKVTIDEKEYICETFPEVWEVLEQNDFSISEETKSNLIRVLFIQGFYKANDRVSFEIVW